MSIENNNKFNDVAKNKTPREILSTTKVRNIFKKAGLDIRYIDEAIRKGKVDFLSKLAGIKDIPDVSVSGIAFNEKKHGENVENYYFEEAVGARIKLIFNEDRFAMDRFLQERHKHILNLVLTEKGRELIDSGVLSLKQLRTDILSPELFQAEKIGAGSECNVYKYCIGKKELAVKIISEEAQKKFDKFDRAMGTLHRRPDLSSRIGFAKLIVKEMEGLPKKQYELDTLEEYAASQDYIITDIGPKTSAEDIFIASGMKKDSLEEKKHSKIGEKFIKENNLSTEDIKKLYNELNLLTDIGFILKHYSVGIFEDSYCNSDFSFGNFLIKNFDRETGHFNLILIDQGQSLTLSYHQDADYFFESVKAKEAYERLTSYPELIDWLKSQDIKQENKHFARFLNDCLNLTKNTQPEQFKEK